MTNTRKLHTIVSLTHKRTWIIYTYKHLSSHNFWFRIVLSILIFSWKKSWRKTRSHCMELIQMANFENMIWKKKWKIIVHLTLLCPISTENLTLSSKNIVHQLITTTTSYAQKPPWPPFPMVSPTHQSTQPPPEDTLIKRWLLPFSQMVTMSHNKT